MIRAHHPRGRGRRLFRRNESGAAMVEFALVVGLFIFILYGLISFGMILATKQRITNAAAEGARAAVGQTTAAAAISTATTRILAAGLPSGSYTIGPGVNAPTTGPCDPAVPLGAQCVTVTITYDLQHHPVVPLAPGLGLVTPNTITSIAVVQYS